MGEKSCSKCGESQPLAAFGRCASARDGLASHCRACRAAYNKAWRESDRGRELRRVNKRRRWAQSQELRERRVMKKFGLTADHHYALQEAQGGVCAICRGVGRRRLCVDHDHNTGRVRGLLCDSCNRGLGLLKDSAELLRVAAAYLERE